MLTDSARTPTRVYIGSWRARSTFRRIFDLDSAFMSAGCLWRSWIIQGQPPHSVGVGVRCIISHSEIMRHIGMNLRMLSADVQNRPCGGLVCLLYLARAIVLVQERKAFAIEVCYALLRNSEIPREVSLQRGDALVVAAAGQLPQFEDGLVKLAILVTHPVAVRMEGPSMLTLLFGFESHLTLLLSKIVGMKRDSNQASIIHSNCLAAWDSLLFIVTVGMLGDRGCVYRHFEWVGSLSCTMGGERAFEARTNVEMEMRDTVVLFLWWRNGNTETLYKSVVGLVDTSIFIMHSETYRYADTLASSIATYAI